MQLSGHKNLQSLSSCKSASITHQRLMSDTLSRGSISNNGTTSIREQIFHTSLFSAESQPGSTPNPPSEFCQGQSFFAGATISTMNNCVFNIIPSSLAKRPRIDDQDYLEAALLSSADCRIVADLFHFCTLTELLVLRKF